MGAAALASSDCSEEIENRDGEFSSRAGDTGSDSISVSAAGSQVEDRPASLEEMQRVHEVLWARIKAALALKHWELADGMLLELRGISRKFLDRHRASLSGDEERYVSGEMLPVYLNELS